jgi:hypothetical protein
VAGGGLVNGSSKEGSKEGSNQETSRKEGSKEEEVKNPVLLFFKNFQNFTLNILFF